jgi:two-component system, cell cycle response regulator DivK
MNSRTILLVDADEDSLAVYSAILNHLGFRVVMARAADDGVRVAREVLPDLIFSDLFIRTKAGWLPIEELRSDGRTSHIPVVALTARVLEEDKARALASGCARFLMKPIQPSELVAVAEEILSSGKLRPELEAR